MSSNVISTNIPPVAEASSEQQIPNGYAGSNTTSTDTIPSLGIEDVDVAIFDLFEKTLPFNELDVVDQTERVLRVKKPFVVFASGERFALAKRLRPIRDTSGVLILPAIAIRKTNIVFDTEQRNSRGMSQDTGEIIVKKRLAPGDRDFQNLLNKTGFKNRKELYSSTRSEAGSEKNDAAFLAGMLLDPKLNRNIWEITATPSPRFYQVTYEVTVWAQFAESMNHILEVLMTSQLPQTSGYKLVTDSGYWFIAYHDETFQAADNFDEYTDEEKVHKYTFSLNVKAILFAGAGPGQPVPLKKYYSAVDVSFNVLEAPSGESPHPRSKAPVDPFALTPFVDEEPMPLDPTTKQKPTSEDLYVTSYRDSNGVLREQVPIDRNTKKGETVYKADTREELFNILYPVKASS